MDSIDQFYEMKKEKSSFYFKYIYELGCFGLEHQ